MKNTLKPFSLLSYVSLRIPWVITGMALFGCHAFALFIPSAKSEVSHVTY